MEGMQTLQNILITGGMGFIGSNFIPFFLDKHPQYHIVNLDKVSYAANPDNLLDIDAHPRYHFIKGDICNQGLLEYIFTKYDIRGIIHFAAESHVDNSIHEPGLFIKTNIEGTFTLLNVARHHWMEVPGQPRPGYENCRFHQISTDEVYGSLGPDGFFAEGSPYAPNNPYSASKASGDLIVRSYYQTYGMNVVISNCSNNYGPKQHDEKLIPTIIRQALKGASIPIYGDGSNIRDWIYVLDHCQGIDLVFHNGIPGQTYNIGGRNEQKNLHVAQTICRILDKIKPEKLQEHGLQSFTELIRCVADRPGHDQRYAIDATKIENQLGWKAEEEFESGLLKTVNWYIDHLMAGES